jgi:cyanate permease
VDVPQIVALVTAINQTVFAFAPSIIGLIRQAADSYAPAFLAAAAIFLVASAVVGLGRSSPPSRPYRQRQ